MSDSDEIRNLHVMYMSGDSLDNEQLITLFDKTAAAYNAIDALRHPDYRLVDSNLWKDMRNLAGFLKARAENGDIDKSRVTKLLAKYKVN